MKVSALPCQTELGMLMLCAVSVIVSNRVEPAALAAGRRNASLPLAREIMNLSCSRMNWTN